MRLFHSKWNKLKIKSEELELKITLNSGQVFQWKNINENYFGIINEKIIHFKRENDEVLNFRILFNVKTKETPTEEDYNKEKVYHNKFEEKTDKKENSIEELEKNEEKSINLIKKDIENYFNINLVSIKKLNQEFIDKNEIYSQLCKDIKGLRIIKQNPYECLISFICSSNNNAKRITLMLNNLSSKFGTFLGYYKFEQDIINFYSFPNLDSLKTITIENLNDIGFGYRSSYITETAKTLIEIEKSETLSKFFSTLESKDSVTAIKELTKFKGVGIKVASCVALYSLNKHDIVPIDVHMHRFSKLFFTEGETLIDLKKESLGDKKIFELLKSFKLLFGDYAGWYFHH
jgi:N-glycosylase/DNA lyase